MLPPLRFIPLIKRLRWGGTRLRSCLGKEIGAISDAAESWEIADHGTDQSVVAGGAFEGWSIARLMREHCAELVGRNFKQTMFPLLVKFLDAADRLSLQVHPNDHLAQALAGSERGKTESWVIIDAAPGSVLYAGLKPGVTRLDLEAAIRTGRLPECVHGFEARPGDSFLIPAGTIHAVGEGILLAEFQQTSDVTFRLHDWGRTGADGLPRQLHLTEALQCIDFAVGPVQPLTPRVIAGVSDNRVEELVACDHFILRRHSGSHFWNIGNEGSFRILMMLEGRAELGWLEGCESLRTGDTILIPADCSDCRLEPKDSCVVLEAYLPQ
jgi:mannose-6-phosphate isomerase